MTSLTLLDLFSFVAFLAIVVGVSLFASRKEKSTEDYFLAGRSLTWWLIGFSLIASNISTEQFVGMSGSAFGRVGMAIASYEWMAAIVLVLVGWFLLPRFLRAGIYTMPEFLEYRYNATTRAIMATWLMIAYVVVAMATVLYSGAIGINAIFSIPEHFEQQFGMSPENAQFWATVAGIWFIGIVAGAYTIYGGLKAVVWSDLIQGFALIAGATIVTIIGFQVLGNGEGFLAGIHNFATVNEDKLHSVLPWNDPELPWIAVFIGGMWIPHTFYWGLNQFITQRTLGAKSLKEGQKGILFAAALKIFLPLVIVLPGIMAYQLYSGQISNPDEAYPHMINQILPPSLRGIMLAALFGAVMSSFNSMLNSASTILTIDLYRRHIRPDASQQKIVMFGRIATAAFVIVACLWAPIISRFQGVFTYIQMVWGFITPGIVAAFIVGLVVKKTPPLAASGAMILGVPLYGLLLWQLPQIAFLHHMGIVFVVEVIFMLIVTRFAPMQKAVVLPDAKLIDTTTYKSVYWLGSAVIVGVVIMYLIFW